MRLPDLATSAGITERSVRRIVTDLIEEGYLRNFLSRKPSTKDEGQPTAKAAAAPRKNNALKAYLQALPFSAKPHAMAFSSN